MTDRRAGRLRLALPWLHAASTATGSGVRAPAAEWLVARGTVSDAGPEWREWLLGETGEQGGLLGRFPAGPCARAFESGGPPEGTWACARPVHLHTALDHLTLAGERVVLDDSGQNALLDDLNRHFAGEGWRFHATSAGRDWLLECPRPVECAALEPELAAGRNLRELMPAGRDGALVRSLVNELQMLLHEHPVNEARIARGLAPVNSFWVWGFGRASRAQGRALPDLWTDDPWLRGLWTLHGATGRSLAEFRDASPGVGADALVADGRNDTTFEAALGRAEGECLAPAREWLRRGDCDELVLRFGRRAVRLDRGARWRFWRRARPLAEVAA